jgi:hypothetical protein
MICPCIPVKVLENASESLNDSKFMHIAEVWALEERWKESGKDIHGCRQPGTQTEIKKTK